MPLITETYYLSLTQDNRGILRLRCSQNDTLRTVNLKLYNNGSIFVIPSGISASISGVKQNGAVFSKPCTISQNRESVVLQLSSDITNIDGIIVAEIVLNDGEGGRLGTSNFIIQVEKNPIYAGVVQDTETPIEYINDFIEKIQTLTARLNNLITPSGDPSLAEVVDARMGVLDNTTYQTLGARLNAEFQRLSNALTGITILESTGDTTDRTSEILSKLNAYGICKLGKGDFYVNGLVMPEDSTLVGSGKSTRVILPTSVTNGHVVKPRSGCIIENISFYGGFTGTYSELIASGSSAQRHCIILDRFDSISSENVILNNIFINNFVGSAIIQRYTIGCHCENVIINMCYAGIDISNASYDGQSTNVSLEDTRFGIVQNGSNFIFTNCVSKDSAYHIMSDQQNTGCTFSSCSFSDSSLETTSKLASISNAREGVVFDNCLFDSSLSMLLNACDGIVIKGTNFVGSDTFTITVSNSRNTLLLITDCIADVEPVVTNAGTAARITSCYLKDGTAWTISEVDITVDDELSDESENPVQNKVINRAVSEIKADLCTIIQHEPDSTADNAYSVGDYFFMDNTRVLFVVTDAISVGDTIASGVNVSNVSFTSITNLLLSILNSSVNGNTDLIKRFINQIVRHEPDSVADNAYSVGEFFVYDITNSLFKVKADISVGDTISTATNVTNIPYTSIVNYLYGLIEDLKTYTQNALEKTEDVRVLALGSYKIYENAKATNGSKSYDETSVTFTTLDTDTTINAVLFGNNTSEIEVSDKPYTSDTLVAEFDFASTIDGVTMRVYGGSGAGTKTYNLVSGHNKIEFPKTHVQTLYFYRQHNTAVNTFTISNFILYQGSITENPFAFVNVPKRFNKIFTVGDSLTNITGNAGQGKNRWQDVVIEKCGFTGFVKEGGVGYTVATYAGQTSIWECVDALTSNNDVDFVTFWGGTNDWSRSIPIGDFDANLVLPDTATFYGAYISCVRKLLSLYPSKRIILIGTTPRMLNSTDADWSTDGTVNSAGNTLMDFTNAVKTVAEYYGLPYLDLMHTSGINKVNYATFLTQQQHSGDNFYYYLHFTEEGELRIGDTVSGFINSIIG